MPVDLQLESPHGRAVVQLVPAGLELDAEAQSILRDDLIQPLFTTIDEPVNGWATATHVVQAKDAGYVDRVLKPLFDAPNPAFMLRFGLKAGEQTRWRPWTKHIGLKYEQSSQPDEKSGPLVTITTVDELWLLRKAQKLRAHRGNVSDIFKQIWLDYSDQPASVEATVNRQLDSESGYYYQSYESDFDFLTGTLVPAAASASGVSGYRFFLRGRAAHFRTAAKPPGELKTLAYSEGRAGVRGLKVADRWVEFSASGGTGFATLAYDPLRGVSSVQASRSEALSKFSSQRRPERSESFDRAHVGLNLEAEELAKAQQTHEVLHSESFRAEFTATNCFELYAGDALDLKISELDKRLSVFSGLWLVTKAAHTFKEGALSTIFVLTRGEYLAAVDRPVQGPEQMNSGVVVPGIEPQFDGGSGGSTGTPIQATA